jgi:methylglutamate dehydrogenase subunit D
MVSFAGLERFPLAGITAPGHFGRAGSTGLTIVVRGEIAFASVTARRDKRTALVAAVDAAFGIALPDGPRRTTKGALSFAGTAPAQWIASAEGAEAVGLATRLRGRLGPFATVTDQSDARLVLHLTGAHVRDVLAKGVPIDLHPKVFEVGNVAVTQAAYIGVQIDRLDEATYQLATARSTAGSFWSWLSASAAEFGYDVLTR